MESDKVSTNGTRMFRAARTLAASQTKAERTQKTDCIALTAMGWARGCAWQLPGHSAQRGCK
jgi:hypothetical protein